MLLPLIAGLFSFFLFGVVQAATDASHIVRVTHKNGMDVILLPTGSPSGHGQNGVRRWIG
ncbi:MAG: hypothetical protein NVSMB31_12830 [Vulcanimicrobiaceae bacterium]